MVFGIFRKSMKILRHSLFLSWLLYISICVTFIIYYWFYTWYVPKAESKSDVVFELQQISDYHARKQFELIGNVDLIDFNGQLLQSGQEYSFILNIEVPESDANFDIGLFGISADLYDVEGKMSSSFRTTVS